MIEQVKQQIVRAYSKLRYEDGVHLYFWDGVRVSKSVSAKVKELVPPFDEVYWAKWCTQKEEYNGMTEHEIIYQWQTIRKQAAELGTDTHDFLEHFTGHQNPRSPQERAGIKFLKWLMSETYWDDNRQAKKYTILFRELRAYSRQFKYAGTMDLPVYDHELRAVVIFDYKTNKDLFRSFGWMKAPFDFLQSMPYNHYQVQLSYYSLLLEGIGITVAGRYIVYLMADEQYRVIELENYTMELKGYLSKSKRQAA